MKNSSLLKFLSVLVIVIGVPHLLTAQEKTATPDGNFLPRGSYYGVKSSIPLKTGTGINLTDLELPCKSDDEEIIRHKGYTLSFSDYHKQARWVSYTLTKAKSKSVIERGNQFRQDPLVKHGSATNEDYKNSGYDRGHLAPAADQGYSAETMKESFYLSNMSPQEPGFNRGIWKNLESQVREWVSLDSALYIVSGGILQNGLPVIGPNKVSIPEAYYKVILVSNHGHPKGIGFIMPNKKSSYPLLRYAVTIDSVESRSGIDFYCKLPDKLEMQAESELDTTFWFKNEIRSEKPGK